jgi:hypothetical protein
MAFNPSPKVAVAWDAATKFGCEEAIILLIDNKAGTVEYASYGVTKVACEHARKLADRAFDAVMEAYQ